MQLRADLYSFCGTNREACGFGCNPNWGDCWGQNPLVPGDNPYDIFLNGKTDGDQSGIIAALGETNSGLETTVGANLFPTEPLNIDNNLFGTVDVTRREDGRAS